LNDEELVPKMKDIFESPPNFGWLLIFDDVQDLESLKHIIPIQGGTVLVTTRVLHTPNEQVMILDKMERNESTLLLEKLTEEQNQDVLNEISGELCDFPLGLLISGSFVRGIKDLTLQNFLESFKEQSPRREIPFSSSSNSNPSNSLTINNPSEMNTEITDETTEGNTEVTTDTNTDLNTEVQTDNMDTTLDLQAGESLNDPTLNSSLNLNGSEIDNEMTAAIITSMTNNLVNINYYPQIVATTLKIVLTELQKTQLLTFEIFDLLSFLDSETVPFFLIKNWMKIFKGFDANFLEHSFTVSIENLRTLSLVRVDRDSQKFSTHKLVQRISKSLMKEGKAQELIRQLITIHDDYLKLIEKDSASLPPRTKIHEFLFNCISLSHQIEIYEIFEGYAKQFILDVGIFSLDQSFFEISQELFERKVRLQTKMKETDIDETLFTLQNLGLTYWSLGNYSEAKVVYEHALMIQEKQHGKLHPQLLESLNNLGNTCFQLGDVATAKQLFERALEIEEKQDGDKQFYNLTATLSSLGNVYYYLREYEKSRYYHNRSLGIQEKHYGKDHLHLLPSLIELGNAYEKLEDKMKAKDLYERALTIQEFSEKNQIELIPTLNKLGRVHQSLGNFRSAKDTYERSLQIKEKHYGVEHIELIDTLIYLGLWYGDLNDDKSVTFLERALQIQEKYTGRNDEEVSHILDNLENVSMKKGNYQAARNYNQQSLEILTNIHGENSVHVACPTRRLGNILVILNEVEEGIKFLEQSLAIYEAYYGRKHVEVAISLMYLGKAYDKLQNPDMKVKYLEEALEIFQQVHENQNHSNIKFCLDELKPYKDIQNANKRELRKRKKN